MTWIIYATIAVVTGSFINILQRVLMKEKDSDPLTYTIALQLFGAVICFIFAFIKGFEMPPIREYPFNFFLEALLYSFISLFTFKALKFIEASKTTIIFSFGTVVTIIASALFLNEALTGQRLLGTFLIIISIALVSKLKDFSAKGKGAIYALIAAVLGGLALVNDTYLLRFSDSVSYTAMAFLLPGILLSLLYPNSFKKLKIFLNPKLGRNMFLLCFIWSVSAIAFYLAIEKGALASQISPFSQSRVILTVLLGAILLKERENLLIKTIAAFLVVAGVMLIK
ncbi:DMT family transporter [Candidatus Parcubacteria bacterium]|nr:DMT family transporter [Candidatus Parcubacteria bacterium]